MALDFALPMGKMIYELAVTLRGERSVYARLLHLQYLQTQSTEAVCEEQRTALVGLLEKNLRRIPYYRDFVEVTIGLTKENVTERILQLPVLEKEHLQTGADQLRVEGWRGGHTTKTTGGSTGRPVTLWKNREAIAQEMAATWLGYGWFGVNIGDPCVRFWGQPSNNIRRRLRYLAADTAMRRVTLSAFGYDRSDLHRYVRRINRHRPTYLYGYVSALSDLARYLLESGERVDNRLLKCVVTTAEVLSEPQRRTIQRAFGVPVQNEYGCGEVGPIAYECPEGSLHLLPTNQFVEILDPAGLPVAPGEPGAIVITDLTNEVMPLIRYRVGDTGAFGDACACGRPFPVLASVFGREYDFVEAPNGKRFHGEFFMYIFEDLRRSNPEIVQFQVVQYTQTSLLVRVVISADASLPERAIKEQFGKRLPVFSITVLEVPHIARRPSGKMRIVENQLMASGDSGESHE